MKKVLIGVLAFVLMVMVGCTGFNANTVVTASSDLALSLILKNNPGYKEPTLAVLTGVKAYLTKDVTYDQLVSEVVKYTLPEQAAIVSILLSDISTDTPVSKTYLTLFDKYKKDLLTRVEHYIVIVSNT